MDVATATGVVTTVADRIDGRSPVPIPGWLLEWTILAIQVLVVLAAGWYLSRLAVRLTGRTVARRIARPSLTRTVLRGVRATVLLVTLTVVAILVGFESPEILLSVGVFSAVVGIILAPLVASFINGIFILSDRPFEIGDMIEVVDEGHRGFVEDITIRYTKIFTLENTFIVIPNSEIHERDVVNYSAEDERTRIPVRFEITYESDLEAARRIAERAARDADGVISGGPDIRIGSARYAASPTCDVEEFDDDGIRLILRFWVTEPYKLLVARSAVQTRLYERLADADVEFAYPHRHHVFDGTSGRLSVEGAGSPTSEGTGVEPSRAGDRREE